MRLADISLIGWLHTVACMAALALGAMNLMAAKGTASHKRRGTAYTVAMVVAMVLSLFIFRFDIPLSRGAAQGSGVFGLFHWLAIATLVLVVLGYYASRRQNRPLWAYTHPVSMTLSYSVLVGGLVDELFARINILRPLAFVTVHGHRVFPSLDVQMTQFSVDVITLVLVTFFCVKVWRYRHPRGAQAAKVTRINA